MSVLYKVYCTTDMGGIHTQRCHFTVPANQCWCHNSFPRLQSPFAHMNDTTPMTSPLYVAKLLCLPVWRYEETTPHEKAPLFSGTGNCFPQGTPSTLHTPHHRGLKVTFKSQRNPKTPYNRKKRKVVSINFSLHKPKRTKERERGQNILRNKQIFLINKRFARCNKFTKRISHYSRELFLWYIPSHLQKKSNTCASYNFSALQFKQWRNIRKLNHHSK